MERNYDMHVPDAGVVIPSSPVPVGTRGWWAEVEWYATGHGDLVPGAVTLRAPSGVPVTHDDWRRVRVARVIEASRTEVLRRIAERQTATAPDDVEVEDLVQVLNDHTEPRGSGAPRSWSDDHYQRVAEVYRAAVANSERPVLAVMRELGKDLTADVPRSTAKGWVQQARRQGLIPPGRHTEWESGSATGAPTDEGKEG